MNSNLFLLLSLMLVLAVVVSAVMRLLRQPLIVGYIITGIVAGPMVMHAIPDQNAFATFSNIGIALLLFIVGLGLNATIIQRLGRVVLVTAAVQMLLSALVGTFAALWFGMSLPSALVLGTALAFSSTIITVKLLNDRKEQTRLYGQISIGILLLQDVVASLALVVLAAAKDNSLSGEALALLILKGLVLGALLTLVSTQILPRLGRFVAASQEFLFLFALAWGFGIATLFDLAGFSIEVGALFAGVSLAALPYSREIAARLKPLRDFFVVVFFIVLGQGLQLQHMNGALGLAFVFAAIVVLIKPLSALATMGMLGYTRRTSFKTAITLGQISEFSLIYITLGVADGFVPPIAGAMVTLLALITMTLSTYIMKYDEQLFLALEHTLRFFERGDSKAEHKQAHAYSLLLFGYRKGGEGFIKSFQALHRPFAVVDYDPEVIDELEHHHLNYVYGDASDLELLEELGLHKTHLIVSTIADAPTNAALVHHALKANPNVIIICHADSYEEAADLYQLGAMYVMLPHMIGSERIGSFIKRAGLHRKEFIQYRERHLLLLERRQRENESATG